MPQSTSVDQPSVDANIDAPLDQSLYLSVLDWVLARLLPAGFHRPVCKRLAVIISGLIATEKATLGDLTTAVEALVVSNAKGESIARRLRRIVLDQQLDPSILKVLLRPLLPELLRSQVLAHRANEPTSSQHHQRFVGTVTILDETSKEDEVHLVVAGIPIGGVVLPLAVRTWKQNKAMPEGEYRTQIAGVLQEIQEMLPAELRDHVLLVADRHYGIPGMVDMLIALRWNWLLRTQKQTRVLMADGTIRTVTSLVPKPGTQWTGGFSRECLTEPVESEVEPEVVGVFKGAGWRRSQVVAVWAKGQAEPWLLVTSLTASLARVAEYAERWMIERLFLSWKSHGWDIEASGIKSAERLGHLMTGLALATLWRLAMGLPKAYEHLRDIASRVSRTPRQLRLPGFSAAPRPWASKYSLLTWGHNVAETTYLARQTPALCWSLPYWEGHIWHDICRLAAQSSRGQFSAFP